MHRLALILDAPWLFLSSLGYIANIPLDFLRRWNKKTDIRAHQFVTNCLNAGGRLKALEFMAFVMIVGSVLNGILFFVFNPLRTEVIWFVYIPQLFIVLASPHLLVWSIHVMRYSNNYFERDSHD